MSLFRPLQLSGCPASLALWQVDSRQADPQSMLSQLPDAEQRRALAINVPWQQRRFIAARTALRRILAMHYQLDPMTAIALSNGGKPVLPQHPGLAFSLTHQAHQSVIGIARTGALGIDWQQPVAEVDADEVAAVFFSESEQAMVAKDPMQFLTCWSLREAVKKALDCDFEELQGIDLRALSLSGEPLLASGQHFNLGSVVFDQGRLAWCQLQALPHN